MNAQPHTPRLPGLLSPTIDVIDDEIGDVKTIRAWKRVRATSAGLYAELKDSGYLGERRTRVLNALAAMRNATQRWSTACEILRYLHARGEIADLNPNHVRPRLTELSHGWYDVTTTADGERQRVFTPCDIVIVGPKRKSDVSGHTVLTWEIRGRA
jgi:hypothetical protein